MMADPIPKSYPNKRQKPTRKSTNRSASSKKRKDRAVRRGALREEAVERSNGACEWSDCLSQAEHMAHIEGIGRGGDAAGLRDTINNVMMLCIYHHDLLDGRQLMKLREIQALLHDLNQLRSFA
jgi:predicted restriction endonuclease